MKVTNYFVIFIMFFFTGCIAKETVKVETDLSNEMKSNVSPSYCRITFKVIKIFPEEKATYNIVKSIIKCGASASSPLKNDTIKIYFPYSLNPSEENNHKKVEPDYLITGDIKKIDGKTYSINNYKKSEDQ
jgi:hypothetical protein